MNISTFLGLGIGQSALDAAQQTENVIGQNIANASTPGYVRETANAGEATPFPQIPSMNAPAVAGQMGQGVQITSITRNVSSFFDQQDRSNQSALQQFKSLNQGLQQVEGILNEPSSQSLQASFDGFVSSWQTLSSNPSSTAARETVIAQAQQLAETFQTATTQLEALQQNTAGQIQNQVSMINSYTAQIASLNQQIAVVKADGANPNTLQDQRGMLLDQLSQLAAFTYTESSNGSVSLTIGSAASSSNPNAITVRQVSGASTTSQSVTVSGGQIAGEQSTLAEIQSVLSSLNAFLTSLSSTVNSAQASGYAYNSSAHGPNMFQTGVGGGPTVDAAGNVVLQVPSSFTPGDVAAAGQPNSPGDNSNAVALVQQFQQSQSALNNGNFNQYLAGMVSQLGVQAAAAQSSYNTANALSQQSSQMRQSVEGVNVNDEAAKMVQVQTAYNAAAKYFSVYAGMLQTLISSVP